MALQVRFQAGAPNGASGQEIPSLGARQIGGGFLPVAQQRVRGAAPVQRLRVVLLLPARMAPRLASPPNSYLERAAPHMSHGQGDAPGLICRQTCTYMHFAP